MPVARLVLESLRDHIVRPGMRRAAIEQRNSAP